MAKRYEGTRTPAGGWSRLRRARSYARALGKRLERWSSARGTRTRDRLVGGTLILFVGRLLLSLPRSGPVLVADEIGYLTNARRLAGGVAGQLDLAPFYRGGYSLLLWPLIKLSSDPELVYHLALVLNAVLAASVFPLLYLLLTRYAAVPPALAIWAAFAGALYPALTVLSEVTMSENALFPLVCVWLIAFAALLDAPGGRSGLGRAAGLGAATSALWVVHNRMLTVLILTVAAVAWLGLRRRLPPAAVVTVLVVVAAGMVGTHLLDSWLIDHNYGGRADSETSQRVGDLVHQHGLRTALANLIGQTWYLLVATFGLAAAAAGGAVARFRSARPLPPVYPLALSLTALLLLISAAAFPERTRPDMLIYGRYVEIVTPVLVALGIAALGEMRITSRSLRAPLLGFAALTGVVVLLRATASDPEAANRWNVSALPFVTGRLGPGILVGAALVALGGMWALWQVFARRRAWLGAAVIALFCPVIAYGAWNPVLKSEGEVYPDGWESPQPVAARYGIASISYDLDHYDAIGLYAFQWFLPDTSVRLFSGGHRAPPSPYVLSGHAWGREHPGTGSVPIWEAKDRDQVLWRLRL